MAAVRKKFDKYACEDIRTDYLLFDETHVAPAAVIPSRTIVEFDSSTHAVKAKDNASSSDVNNTTVLLLAEDVKPEDKGLVYFIIERTENLV